MPIVPLSYPLPFSLPSDDNTPVAPASEHAKLAQAAEQFEAMFIDQMLKQMRQATRELADEDSVYKNRINQDMLAMADTAVANDLASQRAFGIAEVILRQLSPAPAAPVTATSLHVSGQPVAFD